jgi:hypothetical protein
METSHIASLIIIILIFFGIIVSATRFQKFQFLGDDYKDFDDSTNSESIDFIYKHKKKMGDKWFRTHLLMSIGWCVTMYLGFFLINRKSTKIDLASVITISGIIVLSIAFAYSVNKFMIFDDKILKYSLSKFSSDSLKALGVYNGSEKFSTSSMYKKEYFFTNTSLIFPNGTILDDPKDIPIKSIYLMNYNRNKFIKSDYQEILFFYGKGMVFLTNGSQIIFDELIEEIKKRRGNPLILQQTSKEELKNLYLKHYGFPCKSKLLHYVVKLTIFKVLYVTFILLFLYTQFL